MQLSPELCYFFPPRSKYSPQHPVLTPVKNYDLLKLSAILRRGTLETFTFRPDRRHSTSKHEVFRCLQAWTATPRRALVATSEQVQALRGIQEALPQ
jgi:hypothetical protein